MFFQYVGCLLFFIYMTHAELCSLYTTQLTTKSFFRIAQRVSGSTFTAIDYNNAMFSILNDNLQKTKSFTGVDLNMDGIDEIFVSGDSHTMRCYEFVIDEYIECSINPLSFVTSTMYGTYKHTAFGDVNGDGLIDSVVIANHPNFGNGYAEVYLFLNNGTTTVPQFDYDATNATTNQLFFKNTFNSINIIRGKSRPQLIDWTGDGNLDLFISDKQNYYIFEGNGDGTFSENPILEKTNMNPNLRDAKLFDIDDDGDLDLIYWIKGDYVFRIAFNDGAGALNVIGNNAPYTDLGLGNLGYSTDNFWFNFVNVPLPPTPSPTKSPTNPPQCDVDADCTGANEYCTVSSSCASNTISCTVDSDCQALTDISYTKLPFCKRGSCLTNIVDSCCKKIASDGTCETYSTKLCQSLSEKNRRKVSGLGKKKVEMPTNIDAPAATLQLIEDVQNSVSVSNMDIAVSSAESFDIDQSTIDALGTQAEFISFVQRTRCGNATAEACVVSLDGYRRQLATGPAGSRELATTYNVTLTYELSPADYESLVNNGIPFNTTTFSQTLANITGLPASGIMYVTDDGGLEIVFTVVDDGNSTTPIDASALADMTVISDSVNNVTTALSQVYGATIVSSSVDLCGTRDCNGKGTCDSATGVCTCQAGWWGINCDTQCNCENGFSCVNGACACEYPYWGLRCELTKVCSSGTCNTPP